MSSKLEPCRPGGLEMTEQLIELAGISDRKCLHAADIGCGQGATIRYLKEAFPSWNVSGLDPKLTVATSDMIFGQAEQLPYLDSSMDVLFMECSFSKTRDPEKALGEAIRVLRPDGTLLISDMYATKEEYFCDGVLGRLEFSQTISHRLCRAGFAIMEMMDVSEALADLVCQWIMDGKGASLYETLGADRQTLKNTGCGYFLCVAKPSGLWETLSYAGEHSPFYKKRLNQKDGKKISPGDWKEFRSLPFSTPEDVRENPESFLCVPPREIARIITLHTSGSQGKPKRLFFTEQDLLWTADFFQKGMQYLVSSGQRVTVYMEGPGRFSIGGLLKEGLNRIQVEVTVHGLIKDMDRAAFDGEGRDCFIGVPSQMYRLAGKAPYLRPKTVLLSADYVPVSVKKFLERTWKCKIFTHWGMTETGYGGGVQCGFLEGYHMRDLDLLVEVIHPDTGEPVEEGQYGELVLTTFRRKGMPLIRYRTGDLGRYLIKPCGCGCLKPRLAEVEGRLDDVVCLENGKLLSMHLLDELMFSMKEVQDFTAFYDKTAKQLLIRVEEKEPTDLEAIKKRLDQYFQGVLIIHVEPGFVNPYIGSGKRRIITNKLDLDEGSLYHNT